MSGSNHLWIILSKNRKLNRKIGVLAWVRRMANPKNTWVFNLHQSIVVAFVFVSWVVHRRNQPVVWHPAGGVLCLFVVMQSVLNVADRTNLELERKRDAKKLRIQRKSDSFHTCIVWYRCCGDNFLIHEFWGTNNVISKIFTKMSLLEFLVP